MEALGLTDIEVEYSGFWSQGDGASFTARVYNSENKKFITEALGLKVLDEVAENLLITIRRESTRYSHHNTMIAHVEVDGDDGECGDDNVDDNLFNDESILTGYQYRI